MVERGELGVKSGKGFYDWSKRDATAVIALRDCFVLEVLKAGYINGKNDEGDLISVVAAATKDTGD